MKAVGYRRSLPIDHPESLIDVELPEPSATGHDLLMARPFTRFKEYL